MASENENYTLKNDNDNDSDHYHVIVLFREIIFILEDFHDAHISDIWLFHNRIPGNLQI